MKFRLEGKRLSILLLALAGAGAGCLLLGDPANAQTLGSGESVEIPFVRIFAGLVLAVLIALGAALVLKRQGGGGGGFGLKRLLNRQIQNRLPRRIRIHETHRLSLHADLCRFTAANKEYLVIVSPHSTHVLSVSDEEQVAAVAQPANKAAR